MLLAHDPNASLGTRGGDKRVVVDFGELFATTTAVLSIQLLAAMTCELDLDLRIYILNRLFNILTRR